MSRPRLAENSRCAYCGAVAMAWDHVVPVALIRPNSSRRYANSDWIVPACNECNSLLSDRMLHSVPLRARWLLERYRRKYKKLLRNASWTDEELDELDGTFKTLVIDTMLFQSALDHRLAHLRMVANRDGDYLMPRAASAARGRAK